MGIDCDITVKPLARGKSIDAHKRTHSYESIDELASKIDISTHTSVLYLFEDEKDQNTVKNVWDRLAFEQI